MTLQVTQPSLELNQSRPAIPLNEWGGRSSSELMQIIARGIQGGPEFVGASQEMQRRAAAVAQEKQEIDTRRMSRQRIAALIALGVLSFAAAAIAFTL